MTHEWFDPELPLSGAQMELVPSGAILPSSEANFWDSSQYPVSGLSSGVSVTNRFYYQNSITSSGINYGSDSGNIEWQNSPSGKYYWDHSGIIKLDGPFESSGISYSGGQIQSGIFYYSVSGVDEFFISSGNPSGEFYSSVFSNASENIGDGINDFTIFNDYIHNYASGEIEIASSGDDDTASGVDPSILDGATRIPYLSDLKEAEEYSTYGLDADYLGYNATGAYGVFTQGVLSREYPTIGKFFGPEGKIL
jgi:hypothetical protein